MRTDLNISTTNTDGTKKTSKLSYVNPEANDGTLATLADKFADLSNDTLTAATRNDITDLSISGTPVKIMFPIAEEERETGSTEYRLVRPFEYITNELDAYVPVVIKNEAETETLTAANNDFELYIKSNETRTFANTYKIQEEDNWLLRIGLAITDSGGTTEKQDDPGVLPNLVGDIVIGARSKSNTYRNVAPDLIIHVVSEF